MSDNGKPAPDLQSILATLASLSNCANSTQESTSPPVLSTTSSTDCRPVLQSHSVTSTSSAIDPATITTWRDGLRCVTKIAAQHEHFAKSVRELIVQQRSHELKWYQDRQELKKRQAQRAQSSAKALSILSSLHQIQPTASVNTPPPSTESLEDELRAFDSRIYAAQKSLDEQHERALKGLGVPFFGTESTLIMPDQTEVSNVELPDDRPSWSPVIKESELMELRRKMVEHLETLYRDGPP